MEIIENRALRGANYYYNDPVIFMKVRFSEFENNSNIFLTDFHDSLFEVTSDTKAIDLVENLTIK